MCYSYQVGSMTQFYCKAMPTDDSLSTIAKYYIKIVDIVQSTV